MKKFFILIYLLGSAHTFYCGDDAQRLLIEYHCRNDLLHKTSAYLQSQVSNNPEAIRANAQDLFSTFKQCPGDIPEQARAAALLASQKEFAIALKCKRKIKDVCHVADLALMSDGSMKEYEDSKERCIHAKSKLYDGKTCSYYTRRIEAAEKLRQQPILLALEASRHLIGKD